MIEDELEDQPPRACPMCLGSKWITKWRFIDNRAWAEECPTCHGTGDDPKDKR